ncbi:unnamed protein product [Prorocentrum cordatum]|uniref:Uncharacterized protein n=1 Tax=Prorocentrum cordatum TaxID=2364126 RepID=A0ABN9R8Y4_9DINO|nr:unnamed protein product [Polarella glacialis]
MAASCEEVNRIRGRALRATGVRYSPTRGTYIHIYMCIYINRRSIPGESTEECVRAASTAKVMLASCGDELPGKWCCNRMSGALHAGVAVQAVYAKGEVAWDSICKPAWTTGNKDGNDVFWAREPQ